jgi:hypothetical protein
MIKRIVALMFIASLLGLTACASRAAPNMAPAAEAPREALGVAPSVSSDSFAGNVPGQGISGAPQAQPERLVIKNASLSIVVDDPVKSLDNISNLADEMGGFVVTANMSERVLDSGAKAPQGNITIRIPAERLNEALKRIKAESKQAPLSESINSQDVTSEYTDLGSRLRNLEAAEAQLTEIMGSATKTEDVLSVYNQLVQVREQIEVIKGQMKYYEESAAMSAISVDLTANAAVQPLTIGGWQPVGTARNAVQALINTLKTLGSLVIWILLYILPVLLVLFVIFVLPLRWVWRAWRRSHPKAIKQSKQPVPPVKEG